MTTRDKTIQLIVDSHTVGTRLDVFLSESVREFSRRRAQAHIKNGWVTINGRSANKSTLVRKGDVVECKFAPEARDWSPKPDFGMDLTVHYKDRFLLALEKPHGVHTTCQSPRESGTLANAVAARFPECGGLGRSFGDCGLIQRLDKSTSGILLAARDRETFSNLVEMQKNGGIEKTYLALIDKSECILPREIDTPLSPCGPGGASMRPVRQGIRRTTRLEDFYTTPVGTLVRVIIHRGGRHQIRAHLSSIGCPIVGDRRYGGSIPSGLNRLFLHAYRIALAHPKSGRSLVLDSPLPLELANYCGTDGRFS